MSLYLPSRRPLALGKGVGEPVLRYINGVLAILLVDADGAPARDCDGAPLYEVY